MLSEKNKKMTTVLSQNSDYLAYKKSQTLFPNILDLRN